MRKTTIFVFVSLVMASFFMIYSLNHMKYLAEEESTVAYFGFPFAMRQTEPFSGGYFGDRVRADGKEYVFRVTGIDSSSDADWLSVMSSNTLKTNWNGVALNLITYTTSSLLVFIVGQRLLKKARIAMA
jgi:hypothetical protein